MKKATILVDFDAYFYLANESRRQRGCKSLSPELKAKIWKGVRKIDDRALIDKDSFGGGDGTRTGYWFSWSLDFIEKMLFEAGFSFDIGPVIEYLIP